MRVRVCAYTFQRTVIHQRAPDSPVRLHRPAGRLVLWRGAAAEHNTEERVMCYLLHTTSHTHNKSHTLLTRSITCLYSHQCVSLHCLVKAAGTAPNFWLADTFEDVLKYPMSTHLWANRSIHAPTGNRRTAAAGGTI